MKFCPECGANVENHIKFCADCGTLVNENTTKSKSLPKLPKLPTPTPTKTQSTPATPKVPKSNTTTSLSTSILSFLSNPNNLKKIAIVCGCCILVFGVSKMFNKDDDSSSLQLSSVFKSSEYQASNIEDFVIENGVLTRYIGTEDTIYLPTSITRIGEGAFYGSHVKNVTLPDSVKTIDTFAFEDCHSLKSINIPSSVTYIGQSAFVYCTSLTDITIPSSITEISIGTFAYCTSLKNVTIPNSVTTIGSAAFFNCTSLTSCTIPDSVTSIGMAIFEGCTSLKDKTVPDSITEFYLEEGLIGADLAPIQIGQETAEAFLYENAQQYAEFLPDLTFGQDSVKEFLYENGTNLFTDFFTGS